MSDGSSGTDDRHERDESVESVSSQESDGEDTDSHRKNITSGSLVRPLFHLAWPIIVIQLLQVTYNVADTLYLGRLSAEAVGALSLAFPLIFLLIAVAAGFTTAGRVS